MGLFSRAKYPLAIAASTANTPVMIATVRATDQLSDIAWIMRTMKCAMLRVISDAMCGSASMNVKNVVRTARMMVMMDDRHKVQENRESILFCIVVVPACTPERA